MTNGNGKRVDIDWKLVAQLAQIQCTVAEIAFVCKTSRQTLYNRAPKNINQPLEDYIDANRQGGRASLRRKQYEVAMEGDKTMLIWLGKQYLEQSDQQEVRSNVNVSVRAEDISDNELASIIRRGSQGVVAPQTGSFSPN